MSRPSFDHVFSRFAEELSSRSTCARLQVGCVIVSSNFRHVYGIGYNGNVSGGPNCCDSVEVGNCGCLHAEFNACINCKAPAEVPLVAYVTHLPCVACAKSLVNLDGIRRVVYQHDYRIRAGLNVLHRAGVCVEKEGG